LRKSDRPGGKRPPLSKPALKLETTTLWDYPSQNYGDGQQGDQNYPGATPSYIVWNVIQRYTRPGDMVVDPMAGSGTTLDVARELGRRALGYDLNPTRPDIFRRDARDLPLEDGKADFVFIDPPYLDHLEYSGRPECLGEARPETGEYHRAMEQVIREIHRILKPERYLALYACDSFKKGKPLVPLGFDLFAILRRLFVPVDVIAVVRHNATLLRNHWHTSAIEGNYFLRGFNYLFVMYKGKEEGEGKDAPKLVDRRDPEASAAPLLPRPGRR